MALSESSTVDIPDDPSSRLTALVNFCNEIIASAPDTPRAMSAILGFIVRATGATGAAIALPEASSLVVSAATPKYPRVPGERISMTELAGKAFHERKMYLANSTVDPRSDATRAYARVGTTVISPIMHGRRAYGVLLVSYPATHGTQAKEACAVDEFGSIAGAILGTAIYLDGQCAATKGQAKLANRRAFDRDLSAQFNLYRRCGVPFCLALLHARGTDMAEQVGLAIQSAIRKTDTGFRLDDQLFAVLLKNCSEQHSAIAIRRIASRLLQHADTIVAAPRPQERLRAFRERAERALVDVQNGKTALPAPERSIWDIFSVDSTFRIV